MDNYFVNYYDCKEIKKEIGVTGSLRNVAKELGVDRIGTMHQAGSDAQVTLEVYFKLRQKLKQMWCIESDQKLDERLAGKVYGMTDSFTDDTSHYIE
jgi:CCR4-NOT transcription complex subunit 7/8